MPHTVHVLFNLFLVLSLQFKKSWLSTNTVKLNEVFLGKSFIFCFLAGKSSNAVVGPRIQRYLCNDIYSHETVFFYLYEFSSYIFCLVIFTLHKWLNSRADCANCVIHEIRSVWESESGSVTKTLTHCDYVPHILVLFHICGFPMAFWRKNIDSWHLLWTFCDCKCFT